MNTCGIYLYNINTDRFLIGHVTNTKGAYSIPKGCYDEKDQTSLNTAKRELKEETDINIDELDIKHISELENFNYNNKTLVPFLFIIDNPPQLFNNIRCTSHFIDPKGIKQPEIDFFKWVTISEAAYFLPISQKHNLSTIKSIVDNYYTVSR